MTHLHAQVVLLLRDHAMWDSAFSHIHYSSFMLGIISCSLFAASKAVLRAAVGDSKGCVKSIVGTYSLMASDWDPSQTTLSPWERFCMALMKLEQRTGLQVIHIDG